jgi:hypothetical protein
MASERVKAALTEISRIAVQLTLGLHWQRYQGVIMYRHFLICIVLALLIGGCESQNKSPAVKENRKPEAANSFTGRLQSGMMAIGGEHTGWILAGDGQSGGIEVDVSRVKDQAKANDGKRVTISGRMTDKNYTERGKTSVLLAESIVAAPKP